MDGPLIRKVMTRKEVMKLGREEVYKRDFDHITDMLMKLVKRMIE